MRTPVSPLALLLTWASQWGLWLIFADSTGYREMIAGAAAAGVATYFTALFVSRTHDSFKLQGRDLAQVVHVPEILVTGTWILLRAIARRILRKNVPGGVIAVRFRIGGNDAASRGRRALAVTFLTFAPNNLVFGIVADQRILFFHTVIPQPLPNFMFKMGAEPEKGS
jgi:multisubunit Na+/H+ antiporter MnhE subunit